MRKERKGRACGRRKFRGGLEREDGGVGESSMEVADVCIRRFGGEEGSLEGRVRRIRLDMI